MYTSTHTMVVVPQTTAASRPALVFRLPISSAVPSQQAQAEDEGKGAQGEANGDNAEAAKKHHKSFPQPKLRLEIRDLGHSGATKFLGAVNAGDVLSAAVANVQRLLYRSPADPHTTMPPTRSVTVILRDMGGVAYTTGTDLDNDHKEIHFSLNYINSINPASRLTSEITGVLTHELVHCYQWNALGTCPGGLIEGIADWVRLNCDLSPPHWKRETTGDWDGGYQHTAYFLEYLESRFGSGTIRSVNEKLRLHRYQAKPFWTELLGRPVEQLWGDYVEKTTPSSSTTTVTVTVDEGTQT
ncbi:peptidase of plants and bacteria-domain-containing protein [Bombardia bombarda]|uniref:Peptidase of plants and bacteria-domain-containing protein n=1 Tax=Bombardia bombarda TaxID=252184 RepID=A0AA39X9N4_9PEZI|nr:peptidase of plants and bacteria-domain-containing protein [Bombardia bombarda]